MNKIHRTVWNAALGACAAVPENARGAAKGAGGSRARPAILGLLLLASAGGATWAGGAGGGGGGSVGGAGGTAVGGGAGGAGAGSYPDNGGVTGTGSGATNGATAGSGNPGAGGTAGAGLGGGGGGGGGGDSGGTAGVGGAGGAVGLGLPGSGVSGAFIASTIVGGNGAQGGNAAGIADGGGGGGGGDGVAWAASNVELTVAGSATGGQGGRGGDSLSSPSGQAGGGGGGGSGVLFVGNNSTVQVSAGGSTTGGNGGAGGADIYVGINHRGAPGAGGVGTVVAGDGNTLVNAGSIAGGLSGDGAARADAVRISGNNNALELNAGYAFSGNVVASGTGNALRLGGTANASFDVSTIGTLYQGFNRYSKVNTSTWTLTGTTAAVTPWTVSGGTLSIANDASLGAVSGGLTLDGGTLQTTAGITTSRAITLGAVGGALAPDAGTSLNLGGVISGAGSLTMSGVGTLVLAGNNNYAGGTTISSGTLQVGDGGTTGTLGAGDVVNNGTLAFARSDTLNVDNTIGGTGNLVHNGGGTLVLSGANSYSGGTTVNGGTLVLDHVTNGSVDAAGAGTYVSGNTTTYRSIAINNGATVRSAQTGTLEVGISVAGGQTGTVAAATGTTLTLTRMGMAGDVVVGSAADQGTVSLGLGIFSSASSVGTLRVAGGTLTQPAGSSALNFFTSFLSSTTVDAGATLDMNGASLGVRDLRGAGTVTDSVGGQTLRVGRGDFSGAIMGSTNSLQLAFFGSAPDRTLVLSGANTYGGSTTIDAGSTLQLGNGGNGGSIDNTSAVLNNGALVTNRAGVLTLAAPISGNGTFSQVGSGTTVLAGDNTYAGTTTISAGTLQVGNGGTSGTLGTGAVTNNAALVFNRSDDVTVANDIDGTGTVTQNGTGATTLIGNNTYGGGTTLNSGTLVANNGTALGTGTLTINGGTFSANTAVGNAVAVNNSFNLAGSPSFTGPLALANTPTVTMTGGGTTALSGVLSGNSGLVLDATGPGSDGSQYLVTGASANTYTGTTTVQGNAAVALQKTPGLAAIPGNLTIQGNGIVGLFADEQLADGATVTVNSAGHSFGGAASYEGLVLLGFQNSAAQQVGTIGTLQGNGTIGLGNGKLVIGQGSFSGTISDGAYAIQQGVSGGQLEKTGPGTLTLSGANTYTGGTALKGGTLAVANNSALGTGALAMDDGTTLAFAADGLTIANPIAMTGTTDPTFDTGANTATLTGGISGAADLTKTGTGTLILGAANNPYTGSTTVAQGTLRAGVANAFSAASATTIAAGATLDLAGHNQTLASVNNAGTVSLTGTTPGTVLTVTGPWVGNNGILAVGTAVGNDASPTDRLVLSGASAVASGTTRIAVTNIGGLGAQTTGNGIAVVSAENGGSIGAGAFTLATPVSAGAYDYQLNTTSTGSYLANVVPVVPTDPTTPTTPDTPAAPVIPTYRADVPLYAALPEQLRQSNLAMLGNLHQRTGDDGGTGSNT
ncbi:MAG: autotransporter-associated beta strand repeat-containing protein, partial [Proteobacteria bacterium]|nr:autotransporter-associated beta strand repeat-containing protein [Pseudomonadota bacterium]